jgi:hypothetical protein
VDKINSGRSFAAGRHKALRVLLVKVGLQLHSFPQITWKFVVGGVLGTKDVYLYSPASTLSFRGPCKMAEADLYGPFNETLWAALRDGLDDLIREVETTTIQNPKLEFVGEEYNNATVQFNVGFQIDFPG